LAGIETTQIQIAESSSEESEAEEKK